MVEIAKPRFCAGAPCSILKQLLKHPSEFSRLIGGFKVLAVPLCCLMLLLLAGKTLRRFGASVKGRKRTRSKWEDCSYGMLKLR
jgi:hypothetical protein